MTALMARNRWATTTPRRVRPRAAGVGAGWPDCRRVRELDAHRRRGPAVVGGRGLGGHRGSDEGVVRAGRAPERLSVDQAAHCSRGAQELGADRDFAGAAVSGQCRETELQQRLALAYRDHNLSIGAHWNAAIDESVRAQMRTDIATEMFEEQHRRAPWMSGN